MSQAGRQRKQTRVGIWVQEAGWGELEISTNERMQEVRGAEGERGAGESSEPYKVILSWGWMPGFMPVPSASHLDPVCVSSCHVSQFPVTYTFSD